ncbi:unnamed protein product, partial [Pylaiella littoralis]
DEYQSDGGSEGELPGDLADYEEDGEVQVALGKGNAAVQARALAKIPERWGRESLKCMFRLVQATAQMERNRDVKKAAREEAERESPLFAALREAKLLPREDGEGIKDKEVDKGKGATVKMEHPRPQHWSCVGISDGEDMDWVWDGETFEVVGLESYGGGLGRGDGSGVEGSGADEVTAERKVCYCGGCARSRIIDIEGPLRGRTFLSCANSSLLNKCEFLEL